MFGAAPAMANSSTVSANQEIFDADRQFARFIPTENPVKTKIDYTTLDLMLSRLVVMMGPPDRHPTRPPAASIGTRVRQGHKSRYRQEGSLVWFHSFTDQVRADFTEYREDLERISEQLDISALARNEQLAFWINLHNVALIEHIGKDWPIRQPREILIDDVQLDDAKILTVSGVRMSLRDIREKIVFANWRSPKVIYGFWRGEIGGPRMESAAYTGANVSFLLDEAAYDFVNSQRGTQKWYGKLAVSSLYQEVAPFYFPDLESDVRGHLNQYANEEVKALIAKTEGFRADIVEYDIADMSGGSRGSITQDSRPGLSNGAAQMFRERAEKEDRLRRRGIPTGRVIITHIDLPGDPPNKNAVE